ncbi:hypothetical protein CP533_6282, partial [Ophiocordyceps camponoti-saundersi (nom. inval.)]
MHRFFLPLILFSFLIKAEDVPTMGFDPIIRPKPHETVVAGSSYDIIWDPTPAYASGFVSICLIGGKDQASQEKLVNITDAVPSSAGHYTWSVPPTLGTKPVYGLVLRWNQ